MARKTVVVIGLGYAGVQVAQALDAYARVVAIDRHSSFFHNLAGPLAIADQAYTQRVPFSPPSPPNQLGRVRRLSDAAVA
jgi:NADH dehydrogenase FAD-containing subunit